MASHKYRTVLWAFLNECLFFSLNLTAALLASSLTLWTNTLRIGLDCLATGLAFYVIHRITRSRGGDRFDYGLGKWENLSALINTLVLMGGLAFLGFKIVDTIHHPQPPPASVNYFGLIVLILGALPNIYFLIKFRRLLRAEPSPVILAQYVVYRTAFTAAFLSLLVFSLSSLFVLGPWQIWVDIAGSVLLVGMIVYGVFSLLRTSLAALLDQALDESLQLRIMSALAATFADYRQFHGLRSRHSGSRIFVELFLEYDPDLPLGEVLRRTARLESLVTELIPKAEVQVIPRAPRQETL